MARLHSHGLRRTFWLEDMSDVRSSESLSMTIPAILLDADTPRMQHIVGGVPLLTRHILELHRFGVTEFYLLGPGEVPQAAQHRRLPPHIKVHPVPCDSQEDFFASLNTLPASLQDVFVLRSRWLIDPRLLRQLIESPTPRWLSPPGAASESPVAARLRRVTKRANEQTETPATLATWLSASQRLDPRALETYSPTHRGPVAFYMQAIDTAEDAAAATRMLITTARKTTMDVIASTLDTVFVNRLVFWLSYTRITPNQVTLATGAVGALVALLFLSGWLRLGALLTYAAATLDGVDGKLARTTLQFSRVGELEHVLDFFMEQSWYLTITLYLVTLTGEPRLWWVGGSLMGCDLLVKILYGCGRLLFGKQLEELGDFDRTFRRFGGRRNIYMAVLCIGFWLGFPPPALLLTAAWAVITLAVHVSRIAYHLNRRPLPA